LSQALAPEDERWPGGCLRATAVSRSFEGVTALRDVSVELRSGEVLGLIGPNGAGKTTLVNVMTGFDRPNEGAVELEGRDITSWRPHRRGRAGIARTFQGSHSFGTLSVRENVEVSALGVGASPKQARQRAARLLELLGLTASANEPAAALSHGHERKLEVARALAIEPRFVLMDEPAAGLPEAEIPEFAEVLRTLRTERGAGVMLIDHNMALVMEVCDRIHVLDQGRTLAQGTPNDVRGNLDVTAAYLGESAIYGETEPGNGV
jgi:branched-chain amino acid transport system ATP-binding protein